MTIANQIISFKLSGINYVGTSTQLNYTSGVIAGTALESKALVIDENKNLTGITTLTVANLIASSSIAGTIATPNQPNITSLGTLTSLNVNGILNLPQHNGMNNGLQLNGTLVTSSAAELNYLSNSTVGVAVENKALVVNAGRNISNINTISCSSISVGSTISINNVPVTASAMEINYLRTSQGIVEGSKAVIVDSLKNITGFNSINTNFIISANIAGVLTTASQPNITQLGTLTSLTLSGNIGGIVNIGMTGNLTGANTISSINLSGTLTTANQPNITSLGTIANLAVSGRTTTTNATINSLTLGNVIVDATGAELNNLAGATSGIAVGGKCLVVNLNRDINNINTLTTNSLVSNSLSGTITTSAQANITQLGVLNNLEIGGSSHVRFQNNTSTFSNYYQCTNNITIPISSRLEINNESVRFGTTTNHAIRFMSNNSTVMSIENTGNVNIGSTSPTSFRLNVNGSANFTSINLGGSSVLATAPEINYLSGTSVGSAVNGKALVVDTNRNINNLGNITCATLTSTNLEGTISTSLQPNITSLGTLSSLTVESSSTCLFLRNLNTTSASALRFINDVRNIEIGLRGTGAGINTNCLYMLDSTGTRFLMDSNGNFTLGGSTLSSFRLNVVGGLNATNISIGNTLINSSALELNYLSGITLGITAASKALTVNANRDVSNIRNLSVENISGVLTTAIQSNITQLGVLTSLTMSGGLDGVSNINMTGNILGASTINAISLTGTLLTPSQPNITQLGTLNNIISSGNIKVGTTASAAVDMLHIEGNNQDGLGLQIENRNITSNSSSYVKFTGFSNTNTDYDLARISCGYVPVNSNFGYGYLSFSTRNNSSSITASERMRITENGNVGIGKTAPAHNLDVSGTINCDTLRIGGDVVSSNALDLNKLSGITNGTASVNKALVVDANRNIENLNTISATSFSGNIITASQTNITQLGALSSLTVSGALNATLTTQLQPNITQLGTLTSLNVGGNVGLGVINPSNRLEISGNLLSTNTSGQWAVRATDGTISTGISTNGRVGTTSQHPLILSSGNTDRVRILTNGNVGIGIASPSYPLEVNGIARASTILIGSSTDTSRLISALDSNLAVGGSVFLALGRNNSLNQQGEISFLYDSVASTFNFGLFGGSTARLISANSLGAVAFGAVPATSSGQGRIISAGNSSYADGSFQRVHEFLHSDGNTRIQIQASPSEGFIGSITNSNFCIMTSNLRRITIDTSGYVGIGISTPSAPLDVNLSLNTSIGGNKAELFANGSWFNISETRSYLITARFQNAIRCGAVIIGSDRRIKKNIKYLSIDNLEDMEIVNNFIHNVSPCIYNLKESGKTETGYIAQDVMRAGFHGLISLDEPCEGLKKENDDDLEGRMMSVQYDRIISILHTKILELEKRLKLLEK